MSDPRDNTTLREVLTGVIVVILSGAIIACAASVSQNAVQDTKIETLEKAIFEIKDAIKIIAGRPCKR